MTSSFEIFDYFITCVYIFCKFVRSPNKPDNKPKLQKNKMLLKHYNKNVMKLETKFYFLFYLVINDVNHITFINNVFDDSSWVHVSITCFSGF